MERAEIRDYRFREDGITACDWLKGFGPVGCDADGIASRVGPYVVETADVSALAASGKPQPTESDWLAWLIAVCDDELRITAPAVGTPCGRTESEARELWKKPNSSVQDGFWFPSTHTLQFVRHVLTLAEGFWPEFAECPRPEEIAGLSAGQAEGILQGILSWARRRWIQSGEKKPQGIPGEDDVKGNWLLRADAAILLTQSGMGISTARKWLTEPEAKGIKCRRIPKAPKTKDMEFDRDDVLAVMKAEKKKREEKAKKKENRW